MLCFHKVDDIGSVVDKILSIILNKFGCDEVHYHIQFLRCCSRILTKTEKRRLLENHISSKKKEAILRHKRVHMKKGYPNMEPAKKSHLHNMSKKYKSMNLQRKHTLSSINAKKYKSMAPNEKKVLLDNYADRYKSMPSAQKQEILANLKYKVMDVNEKKSLIQSAKQRYDKIKNDSKHIVYDLDYYLSQFHNKIKEGPYFICSVCNRILYRKSVLKVSKIKYGIQHVFTGQIYFDNNEYICRTCHFKVLKGKVPCQAVCNNLYLDEIPPELDLLEKLEQILIAQRIIFEKIVVMPKGQQRKIKGAICNIPVDCERTCRILPRPPERSGIILLKLKRKLEFKGHVYFQAVHPQIVHAALTWLQLNNPLYANVGIDMTNIDNSLASITDECTLQDLSLDLPDRPTNNSDDNDDTCTSTTDDNFEETDDPLHEHRGPPNETCLQSLIPDYPVILEEENENIALGNEFYSVAPGQNKHPVSLMTDKQYEELAFPVLFPKGMYGYTAQRAMRLTPVKIL